VQDWSPQSWRERKAAQRPPYRDEAALAREVARLQAMPPLVTAWEIDRLRRFIAEAQVGRRFWLQGGDCAETLGASTESVTNMLKVLLQMSLVLVHAGKRPVIRVGRIAGQYAKPRSSANEARTVNGTRVELPSYFGDLINRADFTASAREPDPALLVAGYQQAALTLNYMRSLSAVGFADLHHPENWDMSFLDRASLSDKLRVAYHAMTERVGEALRFMEAFGEARVEELSRVEFFTSHEGLLLEYEAAQTTLFRDGYYDLTAHLVWIGERTRGLDGAHVEFFRGIENPVGVKVGPSADPAEIVEVVRTLNPSNAAGKIVLIPRFGAARVSESLPGLIDAVQRAALHVLWVCDPMHGNTRTLASGVKTRHYDDVAGEIDASFAAHAAAGTILGGVHLELTGDDVTECIGAGMSEADLDRNYASLCDPRLNYRQALELAFSLGERMRGA
jgi:3-deoxy-7-phosphoheptulonate synthase